MQETKRSILQLGNPLLRQVARPIENPQDLALQELVEELLQSMEQANGVGIAAPQMGISKQLVIIASRPTPRYPDAPEMPPTPMLNPRLVDHSDEMEKGWEGCLSVPGIRGLVPRYTSVTVDYLDCHGQSQQKILHDFVARIFQHEYDHLQGIVFVDRVESTRELMSEQEYQRQIIGSTL
ncbi:peptide deformylase [Altericista sp. CCNU0014]|uniref:peptide deformylase n=1 Tax=Altericista sp. CCNU0014 TaxID=3082949 RepID=UPI00384BA58F